MLRGLESTNIYAYSARGNEYLDTTSFTFISRVDAAQLLLLSIVLRNYAV